MAILGGWNIDEMKGANLPQKVQSAFIAVTGGIVGAEYMPVLYVGSQPVSGTNYCVLAVQTLTVVQPEKHLVKMVINEAVNGVFSLVSVSGIMV